MKKYSNFIILIIFTLGTQAFMYYSIKNVVSDYHIINSMVEVPLIKEFVYFYDIWYPFIILNAFLIFKNNTKAFYFLIATMLLTAFLAQVTFIVFPSMIIRPDIEVNSITSYLLDLTYKSDTPAVNCLPSMHCIYCFIVSYYLLVHTKINNKYKILLTAISFLIVLSTVFIKQHIIEDVLLSITYTTISTIIVYFSEEVIVKLLNKLKRYQTQKA